MAFNTAENTEKRLFYSLGDQILNLVAATFEGKRKTCQNT